MIPSYEEIMLPFLKLLSDGKEHILNESHDKLADHFQLSEEEISELLPSGQQPVFRKQKKLLYFSPFSTNAIKALKASTCSSPSGVTKARSSEWVFLCHGPQ
ncbi:MAG: winged helix-turn-helix domain-containing protein [Bacteroidales bacterium]